MKKGIIGKKIGMTQIFDKAGNIIPVTVVEAGPCVVVQKKTVENDGYSSLQLGYGNVKIQKIKKPIKGHFNKSNVTYKQKLKEFKFECCNTLNVGSIIKANIFTIGEAIDVTGISKGKGFQGSIKRHNHHRLKETHGTGPVHRQSGSMGACSTPSRIYKGKGMAGHMGVEKVTVQNLKIVRIDIENNLIAIKGAIPGTKGGIVYIVDSVKT